MGVTGIVCNVHSEREIFSFFHSVCTVGFQCNVAIFTFGILFTTHTSCEIRSYFRNNFTLIINEPPLIRDPIGKFIKASLIRKESRALVDGGPRAPRCRHVPEFLRTAAPPDTHRGGCPHVAHLSALPSASRLGWTFRVAWRAEPSASGNAASRGSAPPQRQACTRSGADRASCRRSRQSAHEDAPGHAHDDAGHRWCVAAAAAHGGLELVHSDLPLRA